MQFQTRQIDELSQIGGTVRKFLLEDVRPRASEIDQSAEALSQIVDHYFATGVMRIMQRTDPSAVTLQREIRELAAYSSGALTFLQTQHLSAIRVAGWSEQGQALIERLVSGRERFGIGFSQLRRGDGIKLTAAHAENGYLLDGIVPWATGEGFFSGLIVAAVAPSDEILFFEVPFEERPGLEISQPFRLLAFDVLNTVALTFNQLALPACALVASISRSDLDQLDRKNLGQLGIYSLGCARASVELLNSAIQPDQIELAAGAQQIAARIDSVREQMYCGSDLDSSIKLRAEAHGLANRAAQAAFVAYGGRAAHISHDAQRLCREALLWTVLGQSGEVKLATLAHLLSN